MAETVTMPKLGFDMAEGTLVNWVKVEGDAIAKGEILAEIETDKATVEVESPYSGVVRRHLVDKGTVVPVGTPIAVITAPDETYDESQGATPETTPTQAPKESAQPQVSPKPEVVSQAQDLLQEAQAGQKVSPDLVGQARRVVEKAAPAPEPQPSEEAQVKTDQTRASPLARKMAEERGLDLRQIPGSGPGGRVIKRDIETAKGLTPQAAATAPAQAAPQPSAQPSVAPQPAPTATAPQPATLKEETVPLERLRATIGRRMLEAKQQVPHFYVSRLFSMDALMALRKQINESLPDEQRISVNDFIVKAVALTLRHYPNINASIEGNQLHRHGHINVGVAVSVPDGLLTVVVADADRKSLGTISSEVREMAARARSGKVRPADIEGSTFSVSNLGMYQVSEFIAIINPPEAAILAVSSAKQMPVVKDGKLEVGTQMNATISADHRVTDGVGAAQFMQTLAEYIENPMRMLI